MPAFQNVDAAKGYAVAAAITKKRVVKFDGTNTQAVTPVTAATDIPVGVAMFSVSATEITRGKEASILTDGIALCECGAAVNEGDEITADTSGRAVTAATGNRVWGYARSRTTAAGQEVAVEFDTPGHIK